MNGNGRRPALYHEDIVWGNDDPSVQQTAGWAVHIKDSGLQMVLFRLLAFIKLLRRSARSARWGIDALFCHAFRQQQEIRQLEDDVTILRAQVANLQRESVERGAREILNALESGEDVEDVLARHRT